MPRELVLTLSCPDRPGIVHAVSGFLAERDCNILDSQQYGSPITSTFFLRVHFDSPIEESDLRAGFGELATRFSMDWGLHDVATRLRVLILVSREGHCLNDLLYRWGSGLLHCNVVGVVSNHDDLRALTEAAGVPFHHLPVTPATRDAQEAQLLELCGELEVDLVVLARYMQILSKTVCDALPGRIINIHHSFLPSFRGGRPYEQAYDHGVKLIGATAHYVTADLDEGPIIEQDVIRVDHTYDQEALVAAGRDVEAQVLSRAVRWHAQSRVVLNGSRTVVFR